MVVHCLHLELNCSPRNLSKLKPTEAHMPLLAQAVYTPIHSYDLSKTCTDCCYAANSALLHNMASYQFKGSLLALALYIYIYSYELAVLRRCFKTYLLVVTQHSILQRGLSINVSSMDVCTMCKQYLDHLQKAVLLCDHAYGIWLCLVWFTGQHTASLVTCCEPLSAAQCRGVHP